MGYGRKNEYDGERTILAAAGTNGFLVTFLFERGPTKANARAVEHGIRALDCFAQREDAPVLYTASRARCLSEWSVGRGSALKTWQARKAHHGTRPRIKRAPGSLH